MYEILQSELHLAQQTLPVAARGAVLVCGGGIAGIAAAVTVARAGAKTFLEQFGVPVSLPPGAPHSAIDKDSVLI